MNDFPAQKTLRALLISIVLLVAWHFLMQDDSMPWDKAIPGVLIFLLGELVRERVVAGTPATDDEELRAERRFRGRLLIAGSFLLMALAVVLVVLMAAPKRIVGFGVLAVAMSMSGAGLGLTMNDRSAAARTLSTREQLRVSQLSALILLVVLALGGSIIALGALSDWELTHSVSMRAMLQMAAFGVGAIGVVIYYWRVKPRALAASEEQSRG